MSRVAPGRPWGSGAVAPEAGRRFLDGVAYCARFFVGEGEVLKLASGMTAPHRLHDLADVLDLVRSARLPAETAADLHPYVRDKFRELWDAAQAVDPYE